MAVSGAKSGEQKVEVCRSLNTPFFFRGYTKHGLSGSIYLGPIIGSTMEYWIYVGICGNGIAMPLSWLSCFCLTLESLSAISFFRENKSQKAPGPKPHGMLQAGAYGAPQLWPALYPPYDPYAAGYPFASVALSSWFGNFEAFQWSSFLFLPGGYLQSSNSWKPGPGNKDVGSGGGVLSLQFPMAFLRRIPSSWI